MTHTEYITLVNTLKLHDHRYFTLNAPTITDAEYDRLYFMAQDYETAHPADVLADSPTQQCYSVNGNGRKQVAIRTELLSIEKASSPQKLAAWFKKTEKAVGHQDYTVEWKYDGVTCTLVYLDGQLASAAHGHGEGFFATDCLDHVRHMESVPQHIDRMGRIEVRGEIICPQSELHHIGKANERTAAASELNTEHPTPNTHRLCFFAFELIGTDNTTYWQDYQDMQAMGFTCVDLALCNAQNIEDIIAEREQQRDSLPFPTDGLVIKVNNKSLWDSLGRVKHHRKHNVAYKFQPIYYAETTYTGYYTTVGEKTGRITYIAQFEPVTMNGSVFDHASCGSERTFTEKALTPGCRIRVSSHGDVGVFVDGKTLPNPPVIREGAEITPVSEEPATEPVCEEPEPVCEPANDEQPQEQPVCEEQPEQPTQCCATSRTMEPEASEEPVQEEPAIVTEPQQEVIPPTPITQHPSPTTPVTEPTINHRPHTPHTPAVRAYQHPLPNNGRGQRGGSLDPFADIRPGANVWTDEAVAARKAAEAANRPTSEKVIAGVLTVTALCALGIVAFAGLGAAVFFLPLLGGALLKS